MILTIGLLLIAFGLYAILVRRWRKDWPTVRGTVERRVPDRSWRCFGGDLLYRGKQEESWVVYEYLGEEFSYRLQERMHISAGPFLIWSSKLRPGNLEISVNPNKPSKAYQANETAGWEWPIIVGIVVCVASIFVDQ